VTTVVWTRTVRITHWLVALGVIINFFNETGEWHRFIGYACVLFISLRVIVGLSPKAKPSTRFYFPSLQAIKLHIAEIRNHQLSQHAGHNPLGQWAVYLMWTLIMLLAITGWLSRTDQFWGEDWPVDLHGLFSYVLQGLVLVHFLAVIVMSKLQKRNLVKQIITGQSTNA
jgi:cytochrome b